MLKPRLVIVSHVLPVPALSGQQQRVLYTLEAARELFRITFVAPVHRDERGEVFEKLSSLCDDPILLTSRYLEKGARMTWHRMAAAAYALRTGLKSSNYAIGRVEFSPARLAPVVLSKDFDCALFEYWHAAAGSQVFREREIPCVLDMHDILWRSYARQLDTRPGLPKGLKRWVVRRYKAREERAWRQFDAVAAINREEYGYVQRSGVGESTKLFYAPMGVNLRRWPYSWEPVQPVRVAFYGGLGSPHNQEGAVRCFRGIMPKIWDRFPDAQLWLVGSNPPDRIRSLSADSRVHVTGFVQNVHRILATMTCVLCPWSGTYGFRSRLVEVMALGVPVVASSDAVYGMDLEDGRGVLLGEDDDALSHWTIQLIENAAFAKQQSRLARESVERLFSMENTYGRWMLEISEWLAARKASRA